MQGAGFHDMRVEQLTTERFVAGAALIRRAPLRYSANRRSSEPGLVPCNRGSGLPGIDLALGRRVGRTHPYQSRALPSDLDALRRNDYAGGINRPSSTSCAARLHRAFGCAHAQRPSSHAVAANNARFFRAERSIKSTPLVASLMETVNAIA
jgi:hypothetical protein